MAETELLVLLAIGVVFLAIQLSQWDYYKAKAIKKQREKELKKRYGLKETGVKSLAEEEEE